MSRFSFLSNRRFLRAALVVLALLIVLLPSSSTGSSLTRITSGVLMVIAGLFFYLGCLEYSSGIFYRDFWRFTQSQTTRMIMEPIEL